MPPPYRAILFDLDGTLISEQDGVDEATSAVAAALRAAGHAVNDAALIAARIEVVAAARAASGGSWPSWLTRVEWLRRAFSRVGAPPRLAQPMAAVYLEERLARLCYLPHARPLLEALAGRTRLGLITNGPSQEQRRKIERMDLARYFETTVISEELGAAKPDPAIFHEALSRLGLEPADSVYIGNSFLHDIEGAAAAGIDAIWLNAEGRDPPEGTQAGPRAVIRGLGELPGLLAL